MLLVNTDLYSSLFFCPFFWRLSQKRSQRMSILGSHSPLHHSSLNSGKSGGQQGRQGCWFLQFCFKHVGFLCSHPYSSAVVPRQNHQRRISPHHPPTGASRRVGVSVHCMEIKAKLFFQVFFLKISSFYMPLPSLPAQVVSRESQSEQPQGICANVVPSPENQTFPDTTGMHSLMFNYYSKWSALH